MENMENSENKVSKNNEDIFKDELFESLKFSNENNTKFSDDSSKDSDFKSENVLDTNNDTDNNKDNLDSNEVLGNTLNSTSNTKIKYLTEGGIFSFLFVFSIVFTSFIFIFNYILMPIKVVGTSMRPTLNSSAYNEGDSDNTHCDIVYYSKENLYSTNEIVIIENTNNKYVPDNEVTSVIKRVIATPNQTVRFYLTRQELITSESSILHTNYRCYYNIEVFDENGKNINLNQYYLDAEMYFTTQQLIYYSNENYTNYQLFAEIFSTVLSSENNEYLYTVSENCYFVMGDNRNNSTDSRFFGEVSYDDISGSVKLIVAYNSSLLQSIWIKIKSYFNCFEVSLWKNI